MEDARAPVLPPRSSKKGGWAVVSQRLIQALLHIVENPSRSLLLGCEDARHADSREAESSGVPADLPRIRCAGRPLTGPRPHAARLRGQAALLRAQEAEARLLETVKVPQRQSPIPRPAKHGSQQRARPAPQGRAGLDQPAATLPRPRWPPLPVSPVLPGEGWRRPECRRRPTEPGSHRCIAPPALGGPNCDRGAGRKGSQVFLEARSGTLLLHLFPLGLRKGAGRETELCKGVFRS